MRATLGNTLFGPGTVPTRRQFTSRAPVAPTWRKLEPGAVLLAIDPSSSAAGWCVMRFTGTHAMYIDSGVFRPHDSEDRAKLEHLSLLIAQRIRKSREVGEVLTDAIVEIPRGGGRAGELMLTYAQSVGVCRSTCYRAGLRLHTIGASKWRKSTADCKAITARIVRATFTQCAAKTENNELDAIGLGLWLVEMSKLRMRAG